MSEYGKSIVKQFRVHKDVNDEYWRSMHVKFDTIHEKDNEGINLSLRDIVRKLSIDELNEISGLLGCGVFDEKEAILKDWSKLSQEDRQLLLKLWDFQLRRNKFINKYYENEFTGEQENSLSSGLGQILQLYQDSPTNLAKIYTRQLWNGKSSGDIYIIKKESLSFEIANKIATDLNYEKQLTDELYRSSGKGNNYRYFSYTAAGEEKIQIVIFKKVNDVPKHDYRRTIRHQEVALIMFEINLDEKTVEIKSANKTEKDTIAKYIGNTFGGEVAPLMPEVFDDFDPKEIVKIMSGSKLEREDSEDFTIHKVTFRRCNLKNAPKSSFEHNDLDVWESVKDAHEQNFLKFESLKDIEELTFKAVSVKRTIRSSVLKTGNVVTFDDSRLEQNKKEAIKMLFEKRFGFPLFKQITNDKFPSGKADKVDYAMAYNKRTGDVAHELYNELIDQGFIVEGKQKMLICKDPVCSFETYLQDEDDIPDKCEICEEELREEEVDTFSIKLDKIKRFIKASVKAFAAENDWTVSSGDSTLTVGRKKLEFITLKHNETGEVINIHLTNDLLTKKALERMHKRLTPTILVFVGK